MEFIKNNKLILSVIIILVLSAIGYAIFYINEEKNEINFEQQIETVDIIEELEIIEKSKIYIDVSGEVVNPGLYELDEGSRINDAINIAGGVTEKACLDNVNLAYILSDGIKITIPKKSKNITYINTPVIFTGASNDGEQLININTATVEELCKLDGIGESTAKKIITFRNQKGGFKSKEELKNVAGIGEAKFNSIKNDITI